MRRYRFVLPLTLLALAPCAPAPAQPITRLAAIGDSLTDEYFESSFGYARNWGWLLVEERAVDMGPLGAPDWGEPRRTGYEENWARNGATTDLAISQGQHTGVAADVTANGVTHVVVFVGANDFSPLTGNAAWNPLYNGTWNQGQIDAYVAGRVANVTTILDTLLPTGVRVVLAGVPDTASTPAAELVFPSVTGRERVAQAVGQFGEALLALAEERHLVFTDGWGLSRLMLGPPAAQRATLAVGNVAIDLAQIDPDGSSPANAWVSDGFHPNTVLQGISANLLIHALDAYGAGLSPFTEEELDLNANLAYGGSDTLEGELGATVASFVHDFYTIFVDGFEAETMDAWSAHTP